jgi:hypothetical protein
MLFIIDANIFYGYYKETVLELDDNDLTDSPVKLFNNLGKDFILCFDRTGHIKNEWEKCGGVEWFNAWYSKILIEGKAYEIDPINDPTLYKKLKQLGFPDSNDIWYIKTAKSVVANQGETEFISEDMDFYSPNEKKCGCSRRLRIINNGIGPVCKFLRKKESIYVKSVLTFNNEYF